MTKPLRKLLGRADSISPGITYLQTSISQDVLFRQTTKGKNKSGEIEYLEKWNISSEIEQFSRKKASLLFRNRTVVLNITSAVRF